VHTTSRIAVVVNFKENYGLSDHRGWRDDAVDCCSLLSIVGCVAQRQNVSLWPANFPCPVLDVQLTGNHLCGSTVHYRSTNQAN